MSRSNRSLVVIGVTALALSAGVVAGMVVARVGKGTRNANPPGAGAPGLTDALDLNAQQREEMRKIWENVRASVRQSFESAEALQRQRDEAVLQMLSDEQKQRFSKITQEYSERFDQLRAGRDRTFAEAVEKTRKLLNDSQRKKYDDMLKTHVRPEQMDLTTTVTTTAPATAPVESGRLR